MLKHKVSLTITFGSILLLFCLLLTILWNFTLIYNYSQIKDYSGSIKEYSEYFQLLILIIGSFFFLVIIVGVILFMIFLAKQIMLNQLQKNFIDSVTHELKTPLTSLKLYTETLKKHDLDKNKKEEFLNYMLKDIDRLDSLVTYVLETAKLEHSKNKLENINLKEIIDKSVELISKRYNLSRENFTVNIKEENVKSDPNSIQLVIMNLLDNSVKYSNEKINIIIESAKDIYGRINISVKDSGIGIPKIELKKIFNRFYRADSKKYGTGLGLYIVKETLKKMKAKIEVFSEGENKGAIFKIILPKDK